MCYLVNREVLLDTVRYGDVVLQSSNKQLMYDRRGICSSPEYRPKVVDHMNSMTSSVDPKSVTQLIKCMLILNLPMTQS